MPGSPRNLFFPEEKLYQKKGRRCGESGYGAGLLAAFLSRKPAGKESVYEKQAESQFPQGCVGSKALSLFGKEKRARKRKLSWVHESPTPGALWWCIWI